MNIRYLFKGVEVDDRIKEYVEKRLGTLKKLLGEPSEAEVEIDLDKKGKFRVEVMACTPYQQYRSEEISDSIEASIDIAEGELREQIVKDKEKIKTLRKRGGISLKKKMVLDESARF